MEKIQKQAKVVSISEELMEDYNKDNNAQRVILSFQYVEKNNENVENADLQALLEGLSHNNTYTVILDLASFPGENLRKKVKALSEKIGENTILCTTYTAKITELNDEGHVRVKNADTERIYSSFNRSYVGAYNDEAAVLESLKNRLAAGIDEGNYEWADD